MSDYRLLKPHRIDRVERPAGYVVTEEIPPQLGAWWVDQGIAERIDVAPAPRPVVKALTAPIPPPAVVAPVRRFACCGWRAR